MKTLLPETATYKLFDKWSPSTLLIFTSLKWLETLTRLGISPKEDPWRKWTRAYLRVEESKILLPVFRLNPYSDLNSDEEQASLSERLPLREHVAGRLASFFRSHRELLARRLQWRRRSVRVVDNPHVDVVAADFDDEGRLTGINPCFENPPPPDPERLRRHFVDFFNNTKDFGYEKRSFLMTGMCRTACARGRGRRQEAPAYTQRVAGGIFVHFEQAASKNRFQLPDFSRRKHPEQGVFNILCRIYPEESEVDLWFHASHILVDGNPVLELLQELKTQWGTRGEVRVPAPSQTDWTAIPSVASGSRRVAGAYRFLCFEPLLSTRKELNEKYAHLVGDVTLASLIVWGLAQHHAFRDVKVATVVDLPPRDGHKEERSVSFVNSRPAQFLNEHDRELSFLRFQADFNQQISAARRRESAVYRAMRAQALVPVSMYTCTNAISPRAVDNICGTVCLTIMKHADFCVAPIDNRMQAVVAVGNALSPSQDGGTAGAVSVMAVKGKEQLYREAVCNAICRWRL